MTSVDALYYYKMALNFGEIEPPVYESIEKLRKLFVIKMMPLNPLIFAENRYKIN